jgi:hypothetical protein
MPKDDIAAIAIACANMAAATAPDSNAMSVPSDTLLSKTLESHEHLPSEPNLLDSSSTSPPPSLNAKTASTTDE